MTGRINVYILRDSNGDPLLSEVARGARGSRQVKSIEVRTYFDPDASRNLSNALPAPKPKAMPKFAPRGWHLASPIPHEPAEPAKESPSDLRPVSNHAARRRAVPESGEPQGRVSAAPKGLACPACGRMGFRRSGAGLAWHVERCGKRERVAA